MDIFQTTKDLIDEGLEMRIGERLAGANDGGEIAFHKLWRVLAIATAR